MYRQLHYFPNKVIFIASLQITLPLIMMHYILFHHKISFLSNQTLKHVTLCVPLIYRLPSVVLQLQQN